MKTRPIGQRVKILGGRRGTAALFFGKTGTIIDNAERDGTTAMYRVRFDAPVDVPGVGVVTDDLWAGRYLRPLKGETAQA